MPILKNSADDPMIALQEKVRSRHQSPCQPKWEQGDAARRRISQSVRTFSFSSSDGTPARRHAISHTTFRIYRKGIALRLSWHQYCGIWYSQNYLCRSSSGCILALSLPHAKSSKLKLHLAAATHDDDVFSNGERPKALQFQPTPWHFDDYGSAQITSETVGQRH